MRILGNREIGKQLIGGRDLGTYKELNDILKACSYMMPWFLKRKSDRERASNVSSFIAFNKEKGSLISARSWVLALHVESVENQYV